MTDEERRRALGLLWQAHRHPTKKGIRTAIRLVAHKISRSHNGVPLWKPLRGFTTLQRLMQESFPITSLTETGERIGVTRERVRQLVRKHRIPTYLIGERGLGQCSWCGSKTHHTFCRRCYGWSRRSIVQCDECGAYFARYTRFVNYLGWPSRQNDPRYKGGKFCSRLCGSRSAMRHLQEARRAKKP